ncbi:MAG: WecB/TagA/CpsF family glycosyltransferase [Chthonomonas sp.]|nr:WecB/TagA/CpsF family glycosyltransferase [Chthonomonas sp.]
MPQQRDGGIISDGSTDLPAKEFATGNVLGVQVAATTLADATRIICDAAARKQSGYVCAAPVHSIMEAYDAPEFRMVLNEAFMVVPDGAPVAKTLRRRGFPNQSRVPGPDLTLTVCEEAARRGMTVGFYGSSDECLKLLAEKLTARFSGLKISYSYSPPFRQLLPAEDAELVETIRSSQTDLLFIGLGCPKQENFMHSHAERIGTMMLGVGAAFDFHAGLLERAPRWMQDHGLEWLYRLLAEPKRLFARYAKHNPRFVWNAMLQTWGLKNF